MGRAGPTPSSCRFLPVSLRGPESRADAPGRPAGARGLDTQLLQGCQRKWVRASGDRTKSCGLPHCRRGVPPQGPTREAGRRSPALRRAPPCAPFPRPIVRRQSGRRPRLAPVCVPVPPPGLPLPSSLRTSLCLCAPLPLSRRLAPPHLLLGTPRRVS